MLLDCRPRNRIGNVRIRCTRNYLMRESLHVSSLQARCYAESNSTIRSQIHHTRTTVGLSWLTILVSRLGRGRASDGSTLRAAMFNMRDAATPLRSSGVVVISLSA